MMLGVVLMLLNIVIAATLGYLLWPDQKLDQLPQWFPQICALIGILVVLKPMLMVPARMIVYDDTAFQAVFQMRYYRLSRMYKVALGGFGIIVLVMLPIAFFQKGTVSFSVFTGLYHAVFSFIVLFLTLMAVLWVQQQFDAERLQTSEMESCV
jgi:hypothetical protein